MRLTADGRFRPCLLRGRELEVKAVLRSGGGVAAVQAVLARAIACKPQAHGLRRGLFPAGRLTAAVGG